MILGLAFVFLAALDVDLAPSPQNPGAMTGADGVLSVRVDGPVPKGERLLFTLASSPTGMRAQYSLQGLCGPDEARCAVLPAGCWLTPGKTYYVRTYFAKPFPVGRDVGFTLSNSAPPIPVTWKKAMCGK